MQVKHVIFNDMFNQYLITSHEEPRDTCRYLTCENCESSEVAFYCNLQLCHLTQLYKCKLR